MKQIIPIEYKGDRIDIVANVRLGELESSIMAIHGLGCSKESFDEIWNIKELNGYSVITFDLPGYGESASGTILPYTVEFFAEICGEIIKHLRLKKVHLMGHSLGASIAIEMAKFDSSELVAVANVEGILIPEQVSKFLRKKYEAGMSNFVDKGFADFKDELNNSSYAGSKAWLSWIENTSAEVFFKSLQSLILNTDNGKSLTDFNALNLSKSYFYGAQFPRDNVLQHLDCKTIPIPNAGHFVMTDNPLQFYKSLVEWITENP